MTGAISGPFDIQLYISENSMLNDMLDGMRGWRGTTRSFCAEHRAEVRCGHGGSGREVDSVLVHYCIPKRKDRYIERHCSHCGSDYQELIREPQTTPPGSREPNNQFRITIERNREWLIW